MRSGENHKMFVGTSVSCTVHQFLVIAGRARVLDNMDEVLVQVSVQSSRALHEPTLKRTNSHTRLWKIVF